MSGTELQYLFLVGIDFSNTQMHYQRKIYGIFDILGEVGGTSSFFIQIIGSIMQPISEFILYCDALLILFITNHRITKKDKQLNGVLKRA